MKKIRILLLYAQFENNRTLSYQIGWPEHFKNHPGFHCTALNIYDQSKLVRLLSNSLIRWLHFDAVVILHSVFSNSCHLKGSLFHRIADLPYPKAYFIGNEYKCMPQKMAFCENLEVKLLVTMNPDYEAHKLYKDRLGCEVVCIPSAALDTSIFYPSVPWENRSIDLGYRCYAAPLYIGHDERSSIAYYFLKHSHGLKLDISLDHNDRFAPRAWAVFLNQCKGQLGTEAGGDYFELTDETLTKVEEFVRLNPEVTIHQVRKMFFELYSNPIPGRTISGRHVEAAATKTVQILFEGYYNGYFEPDVHYIPLKKDFSNADEAIEKLKNASICRTIAENAYKVVLNNLTYKKLIDQFHNAIRNIL